MVQMNKQPAAKAGRPEVCCAGLAKLLPPKLFKALSDPKRLSLLVRIAVKRAPSTISQIAEGSDIDLSVVSRHLAVLRDAGIIRCVKRGKEVWCTVESRAVVKALLELADALEACCPDELICAASASHETGARDKSSKHIKS